MRGDRLWLLPALCLLLGLAPAGAIRCERTPEGRMGGRARIDGRYFIKISGNSDSYVPNTVYTVSLQGQRNSQLPNKFTGFLLVAEPESRDIVADSFVANQKQNDVGTFQTLGDSLTKYSEKCPNAVAHASSLPKSEIQALWTAPTAGSGCVTIKATVIEHHDIWYMDEGPLSKTLCENVQESFDMQPPIVSKCCACDEAKYEVTFEGLWSRHTHPKDFPSNGWLTRFSDVIGASHAADYRFWDYGRHSSEGLKQLAEHGATRVLESELKAESNHIRTIIKARGISYPNLTGKTFAVFRVDNRHHLMSLVSMLDPSPDWIVGVSGLELCQANCSWVESKVLNLYPWDAGTDSGPTYISPDQPTTPRDVIRRIRPNFPNDPRSPFYDPSGAEMKPLARLYLSRQRLYEKSCDSNGITGADEDLEADPCAVSAWSEWSPCSKTCGDGIKRRQRFYLSQGRADSAGCSRRLTSREPCKGHRVHCRQGKNKIRVKEQEEASAEEDQECTVTPWSDWMDCSATCGKGWRMRTRKLAANGEEQQDMAYTRLRRRARWESENTPKEETEEAEADGEASEDGGEEEEDEIDQAVDQDEDQGKNNGKCSHIKLVERVECEAALPSCDITEEEARQICSLPKLVGPCRAYVERWFFDLPSKSCEPFGYTGCQGNRNNFESYQECLRVCTSYKGRDQFAGLDTGNQMKHRLVGNLPSSYHPKVTGDGSLSGYDGSTISPGLDSNDIEHENNGRHRYTNRRKENERERNKQRYSSRNTQYRESNEQEQFSHRRAEPRRKYGRESREEEYVAESRFGHRQPSYQGTGVIEEPVGQIKKCEVSPWSEWSGCNTTCGRGFEHKSRFIIQHPVNGGRSCPKKLMKRRKCKSLRPCRYNDNSRSVEDNNYDSTIPTWGPGSHVSSARRDCVLSEWSPWSPCSESCGEGAVRQRTRSIIRPSVNGGSPCSPRLDKQSCDLMACPL